MTPVAVVGTRRVLVSLLEVAVPGRQPEAAGVLVYDPDEQRIAMRFRRDWDRVLDEDSADVVPQLVREFPKWVAEMGAAAFWKQLTQSSWGVFRATEPDEVLAAGSLEGTLERAYRKQVNATVLPFVTHLPHYTARVAAGKFLDDHEVEPSDWVETPESLRLEEGMFVVTITGRSMEPRIPDGSKCVFRAKVAGSRQGKLLLIENRGVSESGGRYTVKRYRSGKVSTDEGWRHTQIRLEPLNPDYEAWDLDEDSDKFRVIGEFVAVLPE